jgi:hypothetical protein
LRREQGKLVVVATSTSLPAFYAGWILAGIATPPPCMMRRRLNGKSGL